MNKYNISGTDLSVSSIALGCMRISSKSVNEASDLIHTALDCGINLFDHADIYGTWSGTPSESLFGEVLKTEPGLRDRMVLQSKCGIRFGYYDFSKEHILNSVDTSLDRLKTDHLDILLLHRPDALMDPVEVAEAFDELHQSGKVRYFGVSNMNAGTIELLQKYTKHKIIANQLQLSLAASSMIDQSLNVNMTNALSVDHDSDILNYCRLNDILIQAWSVLQIDLMSGTFLNKEGYEKLNEVLDELAGKYNVTKAAIAIAWILRHPAGIQAIAGTADPVHLKEIALADTVRLTREEWYRLYLSLGKTLP